MSSLFVASVYLLIGLVLGVVIGRLSARAEGSDRPGLAGEMTGALKENQMAMLSMTVSKFGTGDQGQGRKGNGDKSEVWKYN